MIEFNKKTLKKCGDDVWISSFAEIRRPQLVSLGNHIAIDFGFYMTTQAHLGDHIHISSHVAVIGGERGLLVMENFTNISTGGRIICGSDEFLGEGLVSAPAIPNEYRDKLIIKPVIFKSFANIGANVTILPGVTLGEGSVVGACSLVTKDTEPWTIYYGSPARPIKMRNKKKIIEYAKKMNYYIDQQ